MKYDIVIKKVEPIKVASLRDTIPSYGDQEHLWEELVEYINKHGAKIIPPCMVIYYGEGCTEGAIDAEVIEAIVGDMRIEVKTLPVVEEMAYGAILKYIQDNDYEVIASSRELYLKSGWVTDDPNEYVTELQFPVRKKNI